MRRIRLFAKIVGIMFKDYGVLAGIKISVGKFVSAYYLNFPEIPVPEIPEISAAMDLFPALRNFALKRERNAHISNTSRRNLRLYFRGNHSGRGRALG